LLSVRQLVAPLAGPVTWCSGEHRRKSTLNWRLLLRGGVVGLHPGERLFHFAEDPNRVGNQIRRTIAFEPRDQLSLKSQDSPLRELHQAGDADSDRPVASRPTTPELIDEEVSVLCDIERDGSTKSRKQPVVQSLIERGFIVLCEEPLARVKLTALAQQRLSKRGVGLNES
jgi:hypothetical protein